jgi:hypothetical protein
MSPAVYKNDHETEKQRPGPKGAVEPVNKIFINPVPVSQKAHYISVTKPSQLMLLREIITVYCEK